jgi:hypothetical protein
MGFIKKLKKGVKKTGGALKSGAQKTGGVVKTGAKATGKGIAKGAKHVAAIPKNTYKTTKQLGGALKKPVSHLINDSFSDIVVAILKIPAILTVYGLALCVGILLAVFLGTFFRANGIFLRISITTLANVPVLPVGLLIHLSVPPSFRVRMRAFRQVIPQAILICWIRGAIKKYASSPSPIQMCGLKAQALKAV